MVPEDAAMSFPRDTLLTKTLWSQICMTLRNITHIHPHANPYLVFLGKAVKVGT